MEAIEIAIETIDGTADCRAEPMAGDDGVYFNVTILYPNTSNGYHRSEVYCHDMHGTRAGGFFFNDTEEIHPKIKRLEPQLSAALCGQGG